MIIKDLFPDEHEQAVALQSFSYRSLETEPNMVLAVVEQGISWQCDRISFGRTALDAKSRLGCVPEETHVWARHRVPVLNVIVQQIMKNVHHAEPPDRNPFKQAT